jgi:DNA repair photolyase
MSWPDNRYESATRETVVEVNGEERRISTRLYVDTARTIINKNDSPDVGFSRSINPYRGCENGCVYCFARPTHAYLGLSPGLDFETQIFFKQDAAELLRKELSRKGYRVEPIALGINTDAYQPAEETLKITRKILEVLDMCHHPVTIVTKSAVIERDIDILRSMASRNLVHVFVSITTLQEKLARALEPRAAAPYRRLEVIRSLNTAGIPVGVLTAPVIPFLTDHELEPLLIQARKVGAIAAGYVLLRLPLELKEIFHEWLDHHVPNSSRAVLARMREYHGGDLYYSGFGHRMTGSGPLADLLAQRFRLITRKLGYSDLPALDPVHFLPPMTKRPSRLFPDFIP